MLFIVRVSYQSINKGIYSALRSYHQILDSCIELKEEQRSIFEAASNFSKNELAPNMQRWDRKEHFPIDVLKKAAQLGFSGNKTNKWFILNISSQGFTQPQSMEVWEWDALKHL